jgi:hypothetical protein
VPPIIEAAKAYYDEMKSLIGKAPRMAWNTLP